MDANKSFLKLIKYSKSELLKMTLSELNDNPDNGEKLLELEELASGNLSNLTFEKKLKDKNGTHFWTKISAGSFQVE